MKTILIAEDNDSNFILMSYLLKKHYNIIRAKNGKEAVDYAAKGGMEIILMDIKMPEMDGLEATRIIKQAQPNMPIIALTANAFESDREQTEKAGCNDFVPKPINAELLLSKIKKLLSA